VRFALALRTGPLSSLYFIRDFGAIVQPAAGAFVRQGPFNMRRLEYCSGSIHTVAHASYATADSSAVVVCQEKL
jgi:hypothetical protein